MLVWIDATQYTVYLPIRYGHAISPTNQETVLLAWIDATQNTVYLPIR